MNNMVAIRLLRWFCKKELVEDIEGDLLELYEEKLLSHGKFSARSFLWLEIIKLFRNGIIKDMEGTNRLNSYGLYKNYFKSSVRVIWRQKFYSIVIILCLALGLSFSNILIAYLHQESIVDDFNSKNERAFRLLSDDPFKENKKISFILDKTTDYFTSNYPEIESSCRLSAKESISILHNNHILSDLIFLATDTSFFKLFDFELVTGDKLNAIKRNSIVISDRLAEIISESGNPVGKSINVRVDTTIRQLTISGVINTDEKSHLKFDALIFLPEYENKFSGSPTYFLLREGVDKIALQEKFSSDESVPTLFGQGDLSYSLQGIKDVYFDTSNVRSFSRTSSKELLKIGWIVTGLILIIAGFNFINLFLLSYVKRQKEVGVKKILGATSSTLVASITIDVFIYITCAYFLSAIITLNILKNFNDALETNIMFSDIMNKEVLMTFIGGIGLMSVVSIFYISIRSLNLKPIRMILNESDLKIRLNKYLLTPQFMIAIVLSVCALTIVRQIDYIKQKPLGFNRHLIEINSPNNHLKSKLNILKKSLLQNATIENVCLSNGNPISGLWMLSRELENGETFNSYLLSGDEDIIKTFGFSVIQSEEHLLSGSFVNESLVSALDIKNPIGSSLPDSESKIAGLVEDFNIVSFRKEIQPLVINIENKNYSKIFIDYSDKSLDAVLTTIESEWIKLFPEYNFEYKLIDEELAQKHKEDIKLLKIVTTFSSVSILIACFGLFALAWGIIQNRTKEIGIRKVLGASIIQITKLLSFDFMKWVGIALFIAIPVSYYVMNSWLHGFAYRIDLGPDLFFRTTLTAFFISFIIVGVHAMKVAILNPVNSLRNE